MHDLYAYNVLLTNTCNMYEIDSDPILPHHTDSATLSNRFSAFFPDKIQSIKANIVRYIYTPSHKSLGTLDLG